MGLLTSVSTQMWAKKVSTEGRIQKQKHSQMTSMKFRSQVLKDKYVLKIACWGQFAVVCDYTIAMNAQEWVLHNERIRPVWLLTFQNLTSNGGLKAILGHRGSSTPRYFLFCCSSFFFPWCFLILSCRAESLTRQWGQLQQVRSKSGGKRSLTLCSRASPLSLMEAQSSDCCNAWHITLFLRY